MLTPVRPPTLSFERRRADVERAVSVQGQNFKASYFIDVSGAGETAVDINFPVKFQERPGISFGGELATGSAVVAANYPTVSVVVGRWNISPNYNHEYYIGAQLLIVVGGSANQRMTVHVHAEGKALVAPA